jgi:hypothetical protein
MDKIELPSDFAAVTDADLAELERVAFAAAQPLAARISAQEDLTDDELASLEQLGAVVEGARTEHERRVAVASADVETASRRTAAASVFSGGPTITPPAVEAPTPADIVRPTVGQVAAAGAPAPQANEVPAEGRQSYTKAKAASTAPGMQPGAEFENLDAMANSLEAAMAAFGNMGPHQFARTNVIQLQREYPADLKITKQDSANDVLRKFDAVGLEQNLPGGNLVAAAGWCAPSEILYDLFELENGTDGILDLPELQIHRGGVQVTPGPDFSTIFGGAGYWHQTEANVIAATTKPTMSIACPSFTDNRLEVEGVQITGAFLQDRGYPELVARFTRGAMIAHARKLNIFALNKVANGSTTFDYTNVANLPVTTTEFKDLTVISRLLAVAGIQIKDYQYKYRMPMGSMLECVLPWWVVESVRADVQRRMGIDRDDAFSVAQDQIVSWFALRGARVQFVYDWQEALNVPGSGTNTSTTVGQTAGVYTLPTTIYMLLYAAGTWVRGVADVIRLDTVYDSTNLALNQYIQLFTEDGIQVIKRGFESRMIKVGIDPSGTTSATTNMVTG